MLIKIAIVIVGVVAVIALKYSQSYTLDTSLTTATKGIWFQKTIYLDQYKHLGVGNGLFGKYRRYSRSDRHDMVLTVYTKGITDENN
jgi:hypothetical protein